MTMRTINKNAVINAIIIHVVACCSPVNCPESDNPPFEYINPIIMQIKANNTMPKVPYMSGVFIFLKNSSSILKESVFIGSSIGIAVAFGMFMI